MMSLRATTERCVALAVPCERFDKYIGRKVDGYRHFGYPLDLIQQRLAQLLPVVLEAGRFDYALVLLAHGVDPLQAPLKQWLRLIDDSAILRFYPSIIQVLKEHPGLLKGSLPECLRPDRIETFLNNQYAMYLRSFSQDTPEHARRYAQYSLKVLTEETLDFDKAIDEAKRIRANTLPPSPLLLRERQRHRFSAQRVYADPIPPDFFAQLNETCIAAETQRRIDEEKRQSEIQFLQRVRESLTLAAADLSKTRCLIKDEILSYLFVEIVSGKQIESTEILLDLQVAVRSAISQKLNRVVMALLSLSESLLVDWSDISEAIFCDCSPEVFEMLLTRVKVENTDRLFEALSQAVLWNRAQLIPKLLGRCSANQKNAALNIALFQNVETCLALLNGGAYIDFYAVLQQVNLQTCNQFNRFFLAYACYLIEKNQPNEFLTRFEEYYKALLKLGVDQPVHENSAKSIVLSLFSQDKFIEAIVHFGRLNFLEKIRDSVLLSTLSFDYQNYIPFLQQDDSTPIESKLRFFRWICKYYFQKKNSQGYVEWLYAFCHLKQFGEAFCEEVARNLEWIEKRVDLDLKFCFACSFYEVCPQQLSDCPSYGNLKNDFIFEAMLTQYAHSQVVLNAFRAQLDHHGMWLNKADLIVGSCFSRRNFLLNTQSLRLRAASFFNKTGCEKLRHYHSDSALQVDSTQGLWLSLL